MGHAMKYRGAAAGAIVFQLLPCAIAGAVFAAPRASAATDYPVTARLRMAPREQQHCPTFGEETDCGVLDAVQTAFAVVVSRTFTAGASPDLDLVVEVRSAEVSRILGKQLELTIRVAVLTPQGEIIHEIDAASGAPVLGEDRKALANAARNAAEDAAAIFERAYLNDSQVAAYLVSKKLGSGEAVGVRVRSDRLITLAAGAGFVQGSGDGNAMMIPSLRVALASRWLVFQGMYSRYTSTFQGVYRKGLYVADSDLTTNDLGFELGGVYRLTPFLELRGGPGIHFLFSDGSMDAPSVSQSFIKVAPTLFGSITTSFFVSRTGPSVVVGAEFRGWFFSSVDIPELMRTVP